MTLPPAPRQALLTLHVLTSVGWFGAAVVYLALGVAATTSDDVVLVRALYVTMDWAAWVVLVPLAAASLLTGVTQSLATRWGLFRHYWVVIKLIVTVVATAVLVAYTGTLDTFADVAARSDLSGADAEFLRSDSVVVHSVGALLLLLVATVLAVYKPRGLTRHGQRHRRRVTS